MNNSNRTVVDLNKVSYANFYWTAVHGSVCRSKKPRKPTVNGTDVDDKEFVPQITTTSGETWPRETVLDRATRRQILDTWIPTVRLQLSNSHSLTYTGDKAQSIWKEWNRRQFNKPRKQ